MVAKGNGKARQVAASAKLQAGSLPEEFRCAGCSKLVSGAVFAEFGLISKRIVPPTVAGGKGKLAVGQTLIARLCDDCSEAVVPLLPSAWMKLWTTLPKFAKQKIKEHEEEKREKPRIIMP